MTDAQPPTTRHHQVALHRVRWNCYLVCLRRINWTHISSECLNISAITNYTKTGMFSALLTIASHANVLRGSSRNLSSPTTFVEEERLRDEPVRTFAWEAILTIDWTQTSHLLAATVAVRSSNCLKSIWTFCFGMKTQSACPDSPQRWHIYCIFIA